MNQTLHHFSSHGVRCEADLYLPDGTTKPPVVVLAQGYAALRDFGTWGIITALVNAGIAVFAFDYRGFGGSDSIRNEARQLVDPQAQLQDWQAALNYVARLKEVDNQRMGLWGSSFAGGHVISVAGSEWSRAFALRAVVAQIPHCNGRSALKHLGFQKLFRGAIETSRGALWDAFGITRTVPVVGKPDDTHFSVMQHAGWYEGYLGMVTPGANWENAVPAKSLLKAAGYNPIDVASNIRVPVLMVYGLKDQGIPVEDVEQTANSIAEVERYAFDGDHFDVYDGGVHQSAAVARQIEFYRKHLL